MSQEAKPLVRIAPNAPTFDLPVLVGLEKGLFDDAGSRFATQHDTKTGIRPSPNVKFYPV